MVAGRHAERLEVGGVGPGLLVELAVRDGDGVAAHDEGEIVAAVSSGLDPLGQGQHEASDRRRDGLVTGGTGSRGSRGDRYRSAPCPSIRSPRRRRMAASPRTATPPRWPGRSRSAWQDRWERGGHLPRRQPHRPAGRRASSGSPTGRSSTCSTCSRTRPGQGSTSATRSGYIGTDVFARYQRMTGHNVLHTMGYDAFGLPAEQYAVQTGQHPRVTTEANIAIIAASCAASAWPTTRAAASPPPTRRSTGGRSGSSCRSSAAGTTARRPGPPDRRARGRAGRRRPGSPARAPTRAAARGPSSTRVARREVVDAHRLAYLRRGAGELVPGPRHRAGQRGGHRRRPLRARQLPGVPPPDEAVDDADHRLRRPPARRPRPARLARLDQADAAQLDRPQRGRRGALLHRRRSDHACSPRDPTRCSAPPTWCWPPSTRWSTSCWPTPGPTAPIRAGPAARPRPRRRSRPTGAAAVPQERARPPGRRPREDRRVHRRHRHQPGERRADPRVHRRLRADGLRHRGDHGRARPGPARLGLRRGVRPARSSAPCSRPTAGTARPTPATGPPSTAPTTRCRSTAWPIDRGQAHHHRVAGRARRRRRAPSPTSCATGCSPGSATGASRSRSCSTRTTCPSRVPEPRAAGAAPRGRRLLAAHVRRRRHHLRPRAAAGPGDGLGGGRARPRRRTEDVPPRAEHDAATGPARAGTSCATSTPPTRTPSSTPRSSATGWARSSRATPAASTSTSAASSTPCCTCSTRASGTRCSSTSATVSSMRAVPPAVQPGLHPGRRLHRRPRLLRGGQRGRRARRPLLPRRQPR